MEYGTDGRGSSVYGYGNQRDSYESASGTEYYSYNGRGSVSEITSQTGQSVVSYLICRQRPVKPHRPQRPSVRVH